jgi:phage gp29-like protein
VQERAEDDMTDSDALMLASTIREQLLAPIVLFNLGDGAPLPECQFLTEEERAQKDLAERDQILVRAIGLPIAKKYFYETYEIPEPAEGEDVVSPPAKNITAGENLPEDAPEDQGQADAAKQLDEQATQEQLPNSDRRIVMSTLRALGLNEARRTLHALADVKKKSRAWAR